MSKYILFGKDIFFEDSADRFCELQFFAWDAVKSAKKEFDNWYIYQKNIYNVLSNFADEVETLMNKYVISPLYKTLASEYEIYDLSQNVYSNKCLDLSSAEQVHDKAIEIFEDIEEQLEEEKEYREFRKASRSEVIGGGFGVRGMIKGMATAGAINMTTGAAHSIVNSIGNASSERNAKSSKEELYEVCREDMPIAIESCILSTVFAHIYVVNEYIPDYITPIFDSEKAEALLSSAKDVDSKCKELLVQAFINCPWKYEIYSYIFSKFPEERKNIIEISHDFRVDLEDDIIKLLRKEYTAEAKKSESLAIIAKNNILKIMEELGVEESVVIDEIENDCLNRICSDYAKADENTCNKLIEKVKNYQASEKNKSPFLKKLQSRIEEIWAKEDGEIFDNYIVTLDVLKIKEIKKGILYIKNKGRTSDSKKYIEALNRFKDQKNIEKARKFSFFTKQGMLPQLLKWSGAILAIIGVFLFFIMEDFSFWLQGVPIIAGVILQIYIFNLEEEWDVITVNNKAIHPILTMSTEEYNKLKSMHLEEESIKLKEKEAERKNN